jgi:hypothetical protein
MVTASHNPEPDNGAKLVRRDMADARHMYPLSPLGAIGTHNPGCSRVPMSCRAIRSIPSARCWRSVGSPWPLAWPIAAMMTSLPCSRSVVFRRVPPFVRVSFSHMHLFFAPFQEIAEEVQAPLHGPASVAVGRDTRPSGPVLVAAMKDGCA